MLVCSNLDYTTMDFLQRLIATASATLDTPTIPWKSLIITFSLGEYALETYLQYRQYQVLKRKTIPAQLKHEIDQPTFAIFHDSLVEHLEENFVHVGVGFLDFVE